MKIVFLDKGSLDRGDIKFDSLKSQCETWINYDETKIDDVVSRIKDADIVITNKVQFTESIMSHCGQLKLICVAATGTNNIDLHAAEKHNIPVCNVAGYATHSVVQHVYSLILALHNNLINYQQRVNEKAWDKAKHFCLLNYPISELYGKTLGIIGYGELGRAVAEVGKAFGLKLLIAESLKQQNSAKHQLEGRIPIAEVLQQADIISLHCPLTEQTKNLINKKALTMMKPGSFLINTARGGIVNEHDLLEALNNGTISGAALDVLHEEPPKHNPLIEAKLENLIITPHIAWASQASRQKLVNEITKNIAAFKQGIERNIVTNSGN